MRSEFTKLLKQLRKHFSKQELEILRKAYHCASAAHSHQTRKSGEPYITHSLHVAHILARIGMDPLTCAAGLLHDVIEDTEITNATLAKEFGEDIASLVEGVTKISAFNFPDDTTSMEVKQAQNIRKMLVATAKDVRIILIKLADRLHNMRTIDYLPQDKRERIARETIDIYAPLAHRLGISRWKWELEDHAFHVLMPAEYRAIAIQVATRRRDRERDLLETTKLLEKRLLEAEITAHVIGRPKHLYSIYRKMVAQGKDFNEVMDIQGIRIITQAESGCYNALGLVHNLWTPIPGRLKDFIAMPKLNMYQALHTTVMRENGIPMEVQIRSEEMDRIAREGIAAHWHYKEGTDATDTGPDKKLGWLMQMHDWLSDTHLPEELMDNMRRDFGLVNVYIFTPKGEVMELPEGATPLDFAYFIHTDIGNQCVSARVNGHMVPLRYHLQNGDIVEVMTSPNQKPSHTWLDLVVTGRARTKIRQYLREIGELVKDIPSAPAKGEHINSTPNKTPIKEVSELTLSRMIRIDGVNGIDVHFAKCCKPIPGQPVLGYVTKAANNITVHRADCRSFAKSARDIGRIVEAAWEGDSTYEVSMRIRLAHRPNILADITNTLRPLNIDMIQVDFGQVSPEQSVLEFIYTAPDNSTIDRVARTLKSLGYVQQVELLSHESKTTGPLKVAG